jgi:hypothetical protein
MSEKPFCETVDLSKAPEIYLASNEPYVGKVMVDFFPKSLPTIGPFDDVHAVKDWIDLKFGDGQFKKWFPDGVAFLRGNTYESIQYISPE